MEQTADELQTIWVLFYTSNLAKHVLDLEGFALLTGVALGEQTSAGVNGKEQRRYTGEPKLF